MRVDARVLIWTAFASLLMAPSLRAAEADLHWSEGVVPAGPLQGQRQVLLENERVRVAFLPAGGGRVIRYVDKATGRNGRTIYRGKAAGDLHLGLTADATSKKLRKTHGLSGPLSDAFYEPFLIVFGTQSRNPLDTEANRREAQSLRMRGVRYTIPIKSDKEVTAQDIERYHLILVGGPATNGLLARINSQLPVRIESGAVLLGTKRFAGDDVGLRMIYPNPLNTSKYVVVYAGVRSRGLEGLGSSASFGRGGSEPDVVVTDQRSTGRYRRFLAAANFDSQWQLEDPGPVVGRLAAPLSRQDMECPWGDFRADVLRETANADVALLEVDDAAAPLELAAGEVTRGQLVMMNNGTPIYTIQATGAQIKSTLENWLRRVVEVRPEEGEAGPAARSSVMRRPPAVSGFSYSFWRGRSFGNRVIVEGLDPKKTYRVATTQSVISSALDGERGAGYLGWLPKIQSLGITEIEAQEKYFKSRAMVNLPMQGRVREF